jgi:hypothetical protein
MKIKVTQIRSTINRKENHKRVIKYPTWFTLKTCRESNNAESIES